MSSQMTVDQAIETIRHAKYVLDKHNLGPTHEAMNQAVFTLCKKMSDQETRIQELETGVSAGPSSLGKVIAFRVVNTKGEDSPYRKEWFDREPKAHEIREVEASQDHVIQYAYAGPTPSCLSVIDEDEWEPCSPEYLAAGGSCHAPRVWDDARKNHFHPRVSRFKIGILF